MECRRRQTLARGVFGILALAVCLGWALPARAQTPVLVQATIRDPQGFSYAGAAINITLANPGPGSPTVTPCAQSPCYFQNPGHVTTDANGHFALYLLPNANILPASSHYTFHVDAGVAQVNGLTNTLGVGGQSFDLTGITITTAADLSTNFDAIAPSLTNICSSLYAAQHPGSFPSALCGSGGSGCTLPGTDTGILTEHPVGSCYDSPDATWDDTAFNLKIGGGGATVAGTNNDAIGSSNLVGTGGTASIYAHALGTGNILYSGTYDTVVEGYENIEGSTGIAASIGEGNVSGYENAVGCSSSTATINVFTISGALNDFGCGATATAAQGGIWGNGNTATDTGSGVAAFLYGIDNHVTDTPGAGIGIFGLSNTASDVIVNPGNSAGDATIHGSNDNAVAAGDFEIAGARDTLAACVQCGAVGFNITQSANNTLGVGITQTPELQITQANVRRVPVGISSGPVLAFHVGSLGGSATGTIGQTCSVSFTGGTGSGATGTIYLVTTNSFTGAILVLTAGGSYTVGPTGGTVSNGTATCSGVTLTGTATIGLAPACSSSTEGSYSAIIDSTVNTWGTTIGGGGSDHVLGYCDGTNWTVAAK